MKHGKGQGIFCLFPCFIRVHPWLWFLDAYNRPSGTPPSADAGIPHVTPTLSPFEGLQSLLLRQPASAAEVGELVREAASEALAVYPVGGRTAVEFGLPPRKSGFHLETCRLDQVIDYPARDMTITVQAGLTVARLQTILARENQRLPIDVPHADRATVGGIVAANVSGPRRYGCGTLRDYVIGISVVNDEGHEVKAGGRVVKNVAGYDLGKLFCGSRGRLGRVERLALRLHPLPEAARTIVVEASRWPDVHRSQLVPSAVDLARGRLHVFFEGSQRAVAAQAAALGGEEADPWEELRELQARLPGRARWDGQEAPLVRPGPRVAYLEQETSAGWSPLAERVRAAFDPEGKCSPS